MEMSILICQVHNKLRLSCDKLRTNKTQTCKQEYASAVGNRKIPLLARNYSTACININRGALARMINIILETY